MINSNYTPEIVDLTEMGRGVVIANRFLFSSPTNYRLTVVYSTYGLEYQHVHIMPYTQQQLIFTRDTN